MSISQSIPDKCEIWEERKLKVFESGVLKRIFGSKRDEVTGELRRVNYEELYAQYSSSNIWVIKSRKLRWAGHVAHIGDRRGTHRVLVGKPEGMKHLEDRGLDGRIILKRIFGK
jgi:hypothetical protein